MNILIDPHEVATAANPMRFLIASTGSSGGGKSMNVFGISDIDTEEDHTYVLNIFGVERTITLKSAPADSFDWPVATTGMSNSDWADTLQARIEHTYEFATYYDITRASTDIILTAKEEGPYYDFVEVSNSMKGVKLEVTNGLTGGGTVEGVLMQVITIPGGVIFGEDYKPVDAAGHVKFDVCEYVYCRILHDYTVNHFHMTPGSGGSPFVFQYSDLVFSYRAKFYEKIAGVFGVCHWSDIKWAIAGALNRESLVKEAVALADGMFNESFWMQHFLTWAPAKRYAGVNEPISLFFMLQGYNDLGTLKVILTVVDQENTPSDFELKSFTFFPAYSIIEVLAGYTQLEIASNWIEFAKEWRIWLATGTAGHYVPVSEIRYFYLDETYYENQRSFIFKNSFGVFDSFRCTGKFKSTLEYQREISQMIPEDLETYSNAPIVATKVEESQTFKANSGWLDKTYLIYLRDFLRSTEIYEVDPDGNLFKCILTSKKVEMMEDKNQNYNLSFEYERAYTDQFFSQFTSHPNL